MTMKKSRGPAKALVAASVALVAAEEFALSMVPLLLAVNEVGGVVAAIRILKDAAKKPKEARG